MESQLARENKLRILNIARRSMGFTDPIIPKVKDSSVGSVNSDINGIPIHINDKFKKVIRLMEVSIALPTQGNGPFTIAYIYPREGVAYMIKGKFSEVSHHYFNLNVPSIIHMRIYAKSKVYNLYRVTGIRRDSLSGNCRININRNNLTHRYILDITSYDSLTVYLRKEMRRVPRGWIKELNGYVV
jgi:hypothetical protein